MNRILATTLSLSVLVLAMMGNASAQTPVQNPALPTAVITSTLGVQDADALYNAGVDAFGKMDYAGAIAKFQAAIAKRPTYTDAHFNLGISYAAAGKPSDAVTEFTWVVNKMPPAPKGKRADAFHERGRAYNNLKQSDKALSDFNDALALKPELTEVMLDRAAAFYTAQQFDKAIADYNSYITGVGATGKVDPLIYNNRGLAYLSKFGKSGAEADAKAAIADFDKYIAANPTTNADGYLSRGDAYAALKVYDKAAADYTAYLAKTPNDAYALGARARANMSLKKFPDAVTDYKKLVAAAPTDANAKINLGLAQLQAGDSAGAVSTLNTAVGNPPKAADKTALGARAQAYIGVKEWAKAISDYDALIKLDSSDPTSYFNRAVAEISLNQYDKAVSDFNAYLKSSPKEPAPAYTGLGTAYINLKKFPEAADAYTKYIAAAPTDKLGLYNRGVAYYSMATASNDKAKVILCDNFYRTWYKPK